MPNMSMVKNPMPAQEPDVRNKNFNEVALGYTEEQAIDEAKRCLSSAVDGIRKVVGRLLLGHAQYEIRHVHASWRASDAATHAVPVARSQLVANRTQAVMPGMPAPEFHAHGARIDIELVVDDDQVVRLNTVRIAQFLDRAARYVHEALRFC